MAVPGQVQTDLLEAAAVVPVTQQRIDEPRDVRRLRVRLEGADLSSPDLQGVGQTVDGDVVEIRDRAALRPGPPIRTRGAIWRRSRSSRATRPRSARRPTTAVRQRDGQPRPGRAR